MHDDFPNGKRAYRYRRNRFCEDAVMTLPTEMTYVDLPGPGGPENMVAGAGGDA